MSTSLSNSVQWGQHSLKARGNDLYETPPAATRTLMRYLPQPAQLGPVWEPACGPGAIVKELRDEGYQVHATDLVDYGLENSQGGVDFLMEAKAPAGCGVIITNPPFKLADQFVRHALQLVAHVWVLQRLAYLEGAGRSDIMDGHLTRILVGKERLPMMHRDGWEGAKMKNGGMPFAWFHFDQVKSSRGARLERVSWREE